MALARTGLGARGTLDLWEFLGWEFLSSTHREQLWGCEAVEPWQPHVPSDASFLTPSSVPPSASLSFLCFVPFLCLQTLLFALYFGVRTRG